LFGKGIEKRGRERRERRERRRKEGISATLSVIFFFNIFQSITNTLIST
jgi:hypothetical protein